MHDQELIKKLKLYMETNGYNQTDMANKLGIATSQLNRWLKTECISKAWIALLKEKGIIE